MGPAVAQEISPELVLVCPELRAHALTLLPAVDPDELFVVEPAPATLKPEPPASVLERPRLVLAEPERIALAEPKPIALAEPKPIALAEPEPIALAEPEPIALAEPERRAPFPVALAVYTTEALLLGAVRGAALTAAIAVLAFILAR